jgi:signal transduction histidine kinase
MNEDSAHFQRQLQTLNEITIALSRLDSVDSLCWHAVKFGIERLDFDRIGIWFHDPARRMMVGSYGVDEDGTIRDERGDSWRYGGTYIDDFVAGKTEIAYPNINAPIYNDKSHVVGRGWHIAAPMRDGAQFIGVVTIDNLRYQRPMQPTQPELLRLYGITIGTLTTLARARASAFQLQIEQTRTGVLKQFITAIGHDFRTPLSIINTKAYLITRVQPEQHAPLVNDIQAQVKSIDAMLGRVLSYMTLTDGVMLTPMGNYLDTILTTLHTQFVPLAAAHQITLHLDALMPTAIFADAYYLSSALSEIIENAIL